MMGEAKRRADAEFAAMKPEKFSSVNLLKPMKSLPRKLTANPKQLIKRK